MKANKLYTLIVVIVIALMLTAPVAAQTITRTRESVTQTGYLWWVNDRKMTVLVISDLKQEVPNFSWSNDGSFPGGELKEWISKGWACLALPDSKYALDSTVNHPTLKMYTDVQGYDNAIGVRVTSGNCSKFRGWVYHWAALNKDKSK